MVKEIGLSLITPRIFCLTLILLVGRDGIHLGHPSVELIRSLVPWTDYRAWEVLSLDTRALLWIRACLSQSLIDNILHSSADGG